VKFGISGYDKWIENGTRPYGLLEKLSQSTPQAFVINHPEGTKRNLSLSPSAASPSYRW